MTCSDDDASIGSSHSHRQFGGGRGGQSDVDDVEAHADKCPADNAAHHLSGDAGIAPYDNLPGRLLRTFLNKGGVSRREFHNVKWVERVARRSSDGSTDAGNRFDQCHNFIFI